jgi:hypothetical protein
VRRERLYAVSVSTSVSASSNSRYGSATTASKDLVFGVVHEILLAEKPPLNRAKGLGSGHHDECLRVQSPDGQEVEVQTYIANRDAIDERGIDLISGIASPVAGGNATELSAIDA